MDVAGDDLSLADFIFLDAKRMANYVVLLFKDEREPVEVGVGVEVEFGGVRVVAMTYNVST